MASTKLGNSAVADKPHDTKAEMAHILYDSSARHDDPNNHRLSNYDCNGVYWMTLFRTLLADRTNGRAYATVLRLSVVCMSSSVTLCIVAKRCVLEQKLLLRAYRKSYMRNRLVPK